MRVTAAVLLAGGATLLGACSSDAGRAGGGGTTGAAGSGGTTGSGGVDGGVTCGDTRCGSNQLCVNPSCGGVLIEICFPLGDAAACPDGYRMKDDCSTTGGPGCVVPPCTPPPPSCADIPAACAGTPSCSCLPREVCQQPNGLGGHCAFVNVNNGQVSCLSP